MRKWVSQLLAALDGLTPGLALAAALGCGLISAALGVWIIASDIPNIIGFEGNVIFTIQQALLDRPIYSEPSAPPFAITQYSPLYYWLCAGLARALGVAAEDASALTQLARTLSTSLALATVALGYVLLRRQLGVARGPSLAACAFFFSASTPWYFIARPDSLLSLCTLLTFFCAMRGTDGGDERKESHEGHESGSKSARWLALAGVSAVAALLAKQSGIQAAIVLFAFLGLTGRTRHLAIATAAFLLPLGLMALFSDALFGPFLLANIVDGVQNGISLRGALWMFKLFFGSFAFPSALILTAAVAWIRPQMSARYLLMGVASIGLLAIAMLASFKHGASVNYFSDFLVIGSVSAAAFLAAAPSGATTGGGVDWRRLVALYLILFLPPWTVMQFHQVAQLRMASGSLAAKPMLRYSNWSEVAEFVRSETAGTDQPVLSFTRPISNLLPERAWLPQPEVAESCHEIGAVDYARFRAAVKNGEIGVVVQRRGQPIEPLLGAHFDHYTKIREFERHTVYALRD